MGKIWTGIGVALITPFDEQLKVDFSALKALIRHVSDGGVDYLVVMGTTAESPTLTPNEKLAVLRFVKENNEKNLPIVYGMGSNNTAALIKDYSTFQETVDAFLVVCPYYSKPSQSGLQLHFEAIADVAPSPIILYNVPGRTSVNLSAESTLKLANHPNIMGIKEAAGDSIQLDEIAKNMPIDFSLISGDDDLIVPFIKAGGHGVISVIANGLPKQTADVVNHCLNGDYDLASSSFKKIAEMINLIFSEGNPSGIKSLLQILGIGNGKVRLPLVAGSSILTSTIAGALKKTH